MIDSLIVLILTAVTCSILGVFLVLRKLSMTADAISHSVLLGIVLAFFITQDLKSPLLLVGATIFGVITVALIEQLGKTRLIHYDDAVGVVFPMMFALAVILISRFARNAHLDTDIVLMGEVIYASLDTVNIFGLEIASSAVRMAILLLIDGGFVLLCYKELKLSTFDEEYATLLGLPIGALFYALMTLTSLTAVTAFDAVGAVLVLSFFITPAAGAYLLTKNLRNTIALSVVFAVLTAVVGWYLSILWNVSMSGMCAVAGTVLFSVILLFQPNGWVAVRVRRRKSKRILHDELFLVHIGNHTRCVGMSEENMIANVHEHLDWPEREVRRTAERWKTLGIISENGAYYVLTEKGLEEFRSICDRYGLEYAEVFSCSPTGKNISPRSLS